MKKKFFYFLSILFIFLLSLSFFWIYEAKFFVGRASVSKATFSIDNSYVFISPLQAKANGQEKIRLTVFVLNNQGLGVLGKRVELKIPLPSALEIEEIQAITDQYGKAVFDIKSNQAGEYYLEVKIEETVLPQKPKLVFN